MSLPPPPLWGRDTPLPFPCHLVAWRGPPERPGWGLPPRCHQPAKGTPKCGGGGGLGVKGLVRGGDTGLGGSCRGGQGGWGQVPQFTNRKVGGGHKALGGSAHRGTPPPGSVPVSSPWCHPPSAPTAPRRGAQDPQTPFAPLLPQPKRTLRVGVSPPPPQDTPKGAETPPLPQKTHPWAAHGARHVGAGESPPHPWDELRQVSACPGSTHTPHPSPGGATAGRRRCPPNHTSGCL